MRSGCSRSLEQIEALAAVFTAKADYTAPAQEADR
jgi:hypothetical protein